MQISEYTVDLTHRIEDREMVGHKRQTFGVGRSPAVDSGDDARLLDRALLFGPQQATTPTPAATQILGRCLKPVTVARSGVFDHDHMGADGTISLRGVADHRRECRHA